MTKQQLEHRHIEVFRAFMRSRTVTGASRLLGVSQPAVSKLLDRTEALCGFSLFERKQGRLAPTDLAVRLFEETDRLFSGVEEVSRVVERLRFGTSRRVEIAVVPVLGLALLPNVLVRWRQRSDEQFLIHDMETTVVLRLVASRRVEIGLTTNFQPLPGMRSVLIARAPLMCALPAGHELLAKDILTPADFHDRPYIGLSRYEGLQAAIDTVFKTASVVPQEVAEAPGWSLGIGMVCAGLGISFCDPFAARPFRGTGLELRAFQPTIEQEYRAIWLQGESPWFDRGAFVHALREEARSAVQEYEHVYPASERGKLLARL